jgi:hypothetical protein
MKDIKNFLHLYLGCEVEYIGIINGAELKAEMEAHKDDIFYTPQVAEIRGIKRGYLKNIFTTIKGGVKYQIGRKGLQTHPGTWRQSPTAQLSCP